MQDDNTTENGAGTGADQTVERQARKGWFGGRRGMIFGLLAGTAVLIGGAFGVQAIADSKSYRHLAAYEGGWRHGEHKPLEQMSDAEVEQKLTRMVRHLGIEIDATPEQETRIIDIAMSVAKDIRPLKERMRLTGEELKYLLTADTVDRDALEALRASRLAEAERISKTLIDAVADLAEVLTPAQRETVEQMIREKQKQRGERRRWRRHG